MHAVGDTCTQLVQKCTLGVGCLGALVGHIWRGDTNCRTRSILPFLGDWSWLKNHGHSRHRWEILFGIRCGAAGRNRDAAMGAHTYAARHIRRRSKTHRMHVCRVVCRYPCLLLGLRLPDLLDWRGLGLRIPRTEPIRWPCVLGRFQCPCAPQSGSYSRTFF